MSLIPAKKGQANKPSNNNVATHIDSPAIDKRDTVLGIYLGQTSCSSDTVYQILKGGDFVDSNSGGYIAENDTIQVTKIGADSIEITSKLYSIGFVDTTLFTGVFTLNEPFFPLIGSGGYGSAIIQITSDSLNINLINNNNGAKASSEYKVLP